MRYEKTVNRVTLVGSIAADVQAVRGAGGELAAHASLATKRPNPLPYGGPTLTDWHRVEFRGELVERAETLRRGYRVYVEGSIRYGSYDRGDGQTFPVTDIYADELVILDRTPEVSP